MIDRDSHLSMCSIMPKFACQVSSPDRQIVVYPSDNVLWALIIKDIMYFAEYYNKKRYH